MAIKRLIKLWGILWVIIFLNTSISKADTDINIFEMRGRVPTLYFETSEKNIPIEQISTNQFRDRFQPIPSRRPLTAGKIQWFFLNFSEIDLSLSDDWILHFPNYDDITLFHSGPSAIETRLGGKLRKEKSIGADNSSMIPFRTSELIDGFYLVARVEHTSRKYILNSPSYMHPVASKFSKQYYTKYFVFDQITYLLFIGGMMLMILYSFGIYFMNRDKLFNYYAIYLLALVLYLGVRMPLLYNPLADSFPRFMYAYNELIQVVVNITYLIFASHFMNARVYYPKLHIAIRYVVRILLVIMALQLLLIISVRFAYLEQHLVQFERYFVILFTIIAYVDMIRNLKQKIVFFLVVGSLFFLVGAMMAMFLHNIKYMMTGAAIEVFIFSLAMGYRIKLVEQEKLKIENEINKVKLTALQAQMNPHFIFNSLNSIRAYVISNETRKASDYLTKFARLIRLILHYSSLDTITLEAELEALNLYVELEQMRHRTDFGYNIEIAPGLNPKNLLVPPLILQPYVENAIGHGLAPKQGSKQLQLKIGQSPSNLLITIRDNGVGRSFSKKIRLESKQIHQSVAMDLTSKRINLSDDGQFQSDNITITDLFDNGQPAGTEVKLQLPLQTFAATSKKDLK
jgi:sensor histidine kinase YesM